MSNRVVPSGNSALDQVLQGLRLGDNVVWQVDHLADYTHFAEPFTDQAIRERRVCIYLRFAPHPPILSPRAGLTILEVDPSPGFDYFSGEVHRIIENRGKEVFYIFDNLSALVVEWATDELLANFFQVTCPFLFELDTVTYFALTRGRHAHNAVARIRDTTQVLMDVYHVKGQMYVHPLKVWDRYSPQMFLPHRISGKNISPIFHSAEAAAVSTTARKHPIRNAVSHSIAPWESVFAKLRDYYENGIREEEFSPEILALKQELCRIMIGNHPEFNQLADAYFTLDDLFAIRNRLIGSGRIGGKAAGMLLARRILLKDIGTTDFQNRLETHDSFFIGSDVFFTFLVNNDLFRLRLQLSRSSHITREDFEVVEQRFLEGKFSREILEQFREMLDYFGQAPIIVRSSSLLEDSFGNAFAGKYRSEFCANQGTPEERLVMFLRAVKLVYASTINPDALSYRRKRGLGEKDEQMAILVQRVAGMPYKNYFFPALAGVAFSRNLYAWTNRIDPKQGVIRLVFGLGTRAVNRVGGDYPRLIAVSHPQLRPEVGAKIAKYSQREMDLLNLKTNELATQPVSEILTGPDYTNLYLFVSVMKDGYLNDPYSIHVEGTSEQWVLTFNNLIQRTDFVRMMGEMLSKLENAYGHPIDTEFTTSLDANGQVKINLLQCRPMWIPGVSGPITMPESIPPERILFRADKIINGGVVNRIRFLLYIDPRKYAAIGSMEVKQSLGRVVGFLNEHLPVAEGKILMMGPGRWGSSHIDLGVNVSYADIDNTTVLVELAREEAGHVPEVSYGTHFFQDLVEDQIIYLPVYPDDPAAEFNHEFFAQAPNALESWANAFHSYHPWITLLDVPAVADGLYAHVIADPHSQRAICFLE